MIIGRGSLAKLLHDREGAILFCSGIGNSNYNDSNYNDECGTGGREVEKLLTSRLDYPDHHLIYFSSISIFTKDTDYTVHKLAMEAVIKSMLTDYTIIRLGNIWECTNPNTFLNYIRSHPEAEIRENEIKYMIHADELNMICQCLPLTGRHEISVFSEMLTVRQCLERKNPR